MPIYHGTESVVDRFWGQDRIIQRYNGTDLVYEYDAVEFNETLYLHLGDRLYTVNPTTLNCTLFTTYPDWGYVEGLASDGTNLYVAESGLDNLHTLNPATAQVAPVANITLPKGEVEDIAWNNNLLYTLTTSGGLRSIDITDGTETVIAAASLPETFQDAAYHSSTLYAVDGSTGNLWSIDITDGSITAIGSLGLSAASRNIPNTWLLASHGGTLYLFNLDDNSLYSINVSTGAATKIGTASITISSAAQLFSFNNKLYLNQTGRISEISTTDATVTRGSQLQDSAPSGTPQFRPVRDVLVIGNTLYGWSGAPRQETYSINLSTARTTVVNNVSLSGIQNRYPFFIGSTLYAFTTFDHGGTHRLWTVNTTTGVSTFAGVTVRTRGTGQVITLGATAMTFHNNTLYVIETNGTLYTVNLSTGEYTSIHSLTISGAGLASHGGKLYAVGGWSLSEINVTDGSVTEIGSVDRPQESVSGETEGLVSHGGNLYTTDGHHFYQIDIETDSEGAATGITVTNLGILAVENISTIESHRNELFAVNDRTILVKIPPTAGSALSPVGRTLTPLTGTRPTDFARIASLGNRLYLITSRRNGREDILYRINDETGASTSIGDLDTEQDIWGFAGHDRNLYIIASKSDNATEILYTVDPETGATTEVGSTFVATTNRRGGELASFNGKLYWALEDGTNGTLYEINTTTGRATEVVANTNLHVTNVDNTTTDLSRPYIIGSFRTSANKIPQGYYIIEPSASGSTGLRIASFDPEGNNPVTEYYANTTRTDILAGTYDPISDQFYLVSSNKLYSVDGAGTLTEVGSYTKTAPAFSGIAYHKGLLYLTDSGETSYNTSSSAVPERSPSIHTIDPETGTLSTVAISTLNRPSNWYITDIFSDHENRLRVYGVAGNDPRATESNPIISAEGGSGWIFSNRTGNLSGAAMSDGTSTYFVFNRKIYKFGGIVQGSATSSLTDYTTDIPNAASLAYVPA